MEKNDLLKILLQEREHHTSHPAEVSAKFIYTLGATLTTLVAGFIFKDKLEIVKSMVSEQLVFIPAISLIVIGYILIGFAISEHTKFHKLQLRRMEDAIEYIMKPANSYSYEVFWERFGEKLNGKNSIAYDVKLIAKEPDVRKGLHFHDRKVDLGVCLILVGVSLVMYLVIKYSL